MTDDQSFVPPPRRARDVVRDGIVLVSMTFVALAVGFGLHLQLGFAFWAAAAAATAVYLTMLFSHLMLSQNRETSMLRRELLRLNNEILQLRSTPAEGGVLRDASAPVGVGQQPPGFPRVYQPEVTVPLPSVVGPDLTGRPRATGPNSGYQNAPPPGQGYQADMRSRPSNGPRTAPSARPSLDDAADLLSNLSGLQDPPPSVARPRPVVAPPQSMTPPPPVMPPVVSMPPPSKPIAAVAKPMAVPVEAVPVEVFAVATLDVKPLDVKPAAAKRNVPTGGDRDVEAIHDLIKKLAADVVGEPVPPMAAAPPVVPVAKAPAQPPAKSAVTGPGTVSAAKTPARPPAPAPKPTATGRVPLAAAARPVAKPTAAMPDTPPDLAQALAVQLDTQLPVHSERADVPIAAVAAARTAVEARLAAKANPRPIIAQLPPAVPIAVATTEYVPSGGNDDELASIGAQLAADLGPELRGSDEAPLLSLEMATSAANAPTVEVNVQALKTAAEAMRVQPTVAALTAALSGSGATFVSPMPVGSGVDTQLTGRLELLAEALDHEQFDVCLEAIIGLADRRAQHYEVTVRLRDSDEELLNDAVGTGLLPLLDAAIIDQSARIAWKLEDRGRPGSLFSQITGESLESDRFLNRFADTYRHSETVASRLILAFVQSELRAFTQAHWATLRDMADLGFRFSLEAVTDLDLDFEGLKEAGFAFVKLDAAVFLDGLPMATGEVPAAHVCQFFDELGMTVIVGHIADEEQYDRLLEAGVGLGQGQLFGEARPVKAEVLKRPQRAVA